MHAITMFDSTKESLRDILRSIRDGRTQLPDFQRGWVWDDEHIRSLLASVSMSYPIGAVMMLQTGNPAVRFQPLPIQGVPEDGLAVPERLILDGQQRLTSLFQALYMGQPVQTTDARGKKILRWYYLDIAKALDSNADRDEAIIGLPEDRVIRDFRGRVVADYSSPEKEYDAGMFPLSQLLDYAAWRRGHTARFLPGDGNRVVQFDRFEAAVIDAFRQYQVPLILLRKETPKEAVCQVFEKVNTGGVSLTVFELLTATFAAEHFNLRKDWEGRENRVRQHAVTRSVENTDLLQAVTLLATRERRVQALAQGTPADGAPGISCKRREVLRLSLAEYRRWADP